MSWALIAAFAVTAAAGSVASWYGYERILTLRTELSSLSTEVGALKASLASNTELLKDDIAQTHSSLTSALDQEKKNVEEKIGSVSQTVGTIAGTVGTLEKLSKTDPELLAKYSKVFFLNENYAPARLVEIPNANKYYEERDLQVIPEVLPRLLSMFAAANQAGIKIYAFSAYRSFDTQEALKGQYTVTYGAGTANTFSADQGYSEHQLGTTVDLITTGLGGELEGFDGTAAYQWLLGNAYTYGFVLSYPENNGYYVFEPWHWRFVGIELATYLHNQGKHFYDLDQRAIDEYLVNIFD